ncbi:hypothetical protein TELCIR_14032, partial [Teladorsagia circumcincta]
SDTFKFEEQCREDGILVKGDQMVLDVVLSTDGIEPLYFITPDDLTFQARCPLVVSKADSRSSGAVEKQYP